MAETPMRYIRINDEAWSKAQARAAREGVTLSSLIRRWVEDYGSDPVPVTRELLRITQRINEIRQRLKGE